MSVTTDQRPRASCNLPYSFFRDFVLRALKVTTGKVAMISLVRRLNAAR